jgi:peptidyl-prolyl cis-trans isomerase D
LKQVGDISGLVQSEFGYHIIQLTAIKPGKVPSFDQVRAKLEDQLRTQEAQQKFSEVADEFKNGVYEQADSLKPTADKLGLTIQTAKDVTQTPAAGAQGALANPKFLDALFSADVLGSKHNTEAIEIGANALASGHVTQHTAAHAKSFDEVKATVREQYVNDQGAQQARAAGEKQLKDWTDKPDSATALPAAVTLSRQDTHGEPPSVVEAVMRADPAKLPAFVGVDLGAAGYSIARVNKVLKATAPTAAEAQENRTLYDQLWSAAESQSLYAYLEARYKAKILVPVPTATAADSNAANP